MSGESDLRILLQTLKPHHNCGDYVFCTVENLSSINSDDVIMFFREQEGHTIIVRQDLADSVHLPYSFVAAWITLTVHSSLEAVGLTATISTALSKEGISCNVVAAFYHDHIFVDKKDASKALEILNGFAT
jgi:uncharacterized protein